MLLPALEFLSSPTNGVFTSAQASQAGYPAAEQRSLTRRREWLRLRRGIYTTNERWQGLDELGQHVLLCHAACLATTGEAWVSHHSAAAIHELPTLLPLTPDVRLTLQRAHHRTALALHAHTAQVPPSHRTTRRGLPITTVARTLCDLARHADFSNALVATDHALHTGLVSALAIEKVLELCSNWPGIAAARRVMLAADARAESPGETLSRIAIWASDLPQPKLQVTLRIGGTEYRPDFLWEHEQVIGEFDGLIKYDDRDVLIREKQREDRLRAAGFAFVRWGWNDVVGNTESLIRRIGSALEQARSLAA
jgi:very-short-patch-repair endonuclease